MEPAADTSDRGARVLLHGEHGRGKRTLRLSLLSSGFEGPDAPALRGFFGRLVACRSLRDPSILRDPAGA